MVGGGEVLLNFNEMTELTLSCGIGDNTNNLVEALALLQGLYRLIVLEIKVAIVFGDSKMVIHVLNT